MDLNLPRSGLVQQALERFILRFGQFLLKPLQFLLPELINTLVIALGYRKAVIP